MQDLRNIVAGVAKTALGSTDILGAGLLATFNYLQNPLKPSDVANRQDGFDMLVSGLNSMRQGVQQSWSGMKGVAAKL